MAEGDKTNPSWEKVFESIDKFRKETAGPKSQVTPAEKTAIDDLAKEFQQAKTGYGVYLAPGLYNGNDEKKAEALSKWKNQETLANDKRAELAEAVVDTNIAYLKAKKEKQGVETGKEAAQKAAANFGYLNDRVPLYRTDKLEGCSLH
ncbi:MAG: hypothetical protein P8P83_06060 [Rickettsiaceae bacterium]|nr:hypothetical protein [Rickettsiaceae bacterium]